MASIESPLRMVNTEAHSARHSKLDQYATEALVLAFVDDQRNAVAAVRTASAQIAAVIDAAVPRIEAGGRLVYVGAGTSGRLGLLDSVELYPTFSWPREQALALLAGGAGAIYQAIEGAEDNQTQGALDIAGANVTSADVVLLIAASGSTPYVLGALAESNQRGALTVGIANNVDAPLTRAATLGITLETGAEVISGSTRLKAGTAQKIALNTLSSGIMVRLNKVYGNLMVDVKPTNAKLIQRTINLTKLVTGCDDETALRTLDACDHRVKVAVVAILSRLSPTEARARLAVHRGSVRHALADTPTSPPEGMTR